MTRFDFSAYDPTGRKVWYTLPVPGRNAGRLHVMHAGETNKPYTNALARLGAKMAKTEVAGGDDAVSAMLEKNLEMDRQLFPRHVITGWEGVLDTNREPVPFSPEACEEFLRALPDWLMRKLSGFVSRPANFIAEEEIDPDAFEAQAGN